MHLDELVAGDILAMLFWTFEKSKEQSMGTERWGHAPNCKVMPLWEESTLYNTFWPEGHCAADTTQGRKEHPRGELQRLVFVRNLTSPHLTYPSLNCEGRWGTTRDVTTSFLHFPPGNWTDTTRKLYQPQACVESNFLMRTHLHTIQCWYKSISLRKSSNFATPSILHRSCTMWFFSLCLHSTKSLLGCELNCRSALGSAIFQCLDHIPKEDYKHAFEQWLQRLKKSVAAQGAYFEKMQMKKSV